jgi:hypothetical protein
VASSPWLEQSLLPRTASSKCSQEDGSTHDLLNAAKPLSTNSRKNSYGRLVDRATKLNQREFDVIPEAWARLCDAYEATRSLVASLQTLPDIDNMTSEHQNEFISGCKLEEWQKKELGSAESKTRLLRKNDFLA